MGTNTTPLQAATDHGTATERRYLSVAQTADYFGISERLVRAMIASDELPALKIRSRVLVPRTAITALENNLSADGGR
jgi:excisionase family DNA binding protein